MQALTRDAIARLLPHDGEMVLVDAVLDHGDETIDCIASRHHDAANPLRVNGRLPAWCGIEYAAQAMAIHQGLRAGDGKRPARGFLAVARDVVLGQDTLDALPGDLHIRAERLVAEGGLSLYAFRLASQGRMMLEGRVAVVLQEAAE